MDERAGWKDVEPIVLAIQQSQCHRAFRHLGVIWGRKRSFRGMLAVQIDRHALPIRVAFCKPSLSPPALCKRTFTSVVAVAVSFPEDESLRRGTIAVIHLKGSLLSTHEPDLHFTGMRIPIVCTWGETRDSDA